MICNTLPRNGEIFYIPLLKWYKLVNIHFYIMLDISSLERSIVIIDTKLIHIEFEYLAYFPLRNIIKL